MIYIAGVSLWNDTVKTYLSVQLGVSQSKAQNLLYTAAGSQQAYEKGYQDLEPENDAAANYRKSLIAKMSDYGKLMENISMNECVSFAKRYKYAFIVWTSPQPNQ